MILLIEDEPSVQDIFKNTFDNVIIWEHDKYSEDDLLSANLIFVDRDNPYSYTQSYHDRFLSLFESLCYKGYWIDILNKVYPISWNWLNNDYLIRHMILILEKTKTTTWYVIENREDRDMYVNILVSHTYMKSDWRFTANIKKANV